MGCCGNIERDKDIDKCQNMKDFRNVMKYKLERLNAELEEITKYEEDPTNEINLFQIDKDEYQNLPKRIPYLQNLIECYEQVIDKLEHIDSLPIEETKEYLQNIIKHYYVIYDENQMYLIDLDKFKKFAFKYEKE